jgi:plasmid stability protein
MTLTIDLPDERQAALKAKAQAQGLSAEQYARQVLEHDLEEAPTPPRRRIWDVIPERMKQLPPEDLAALPRDGASQIDHYVYGLPKRDL